MYIVKQFESQIQKKKKKNKLTNLWGGKKLLMDTKFSFQLRFIFMKLKNTS